jgi:hypothetical protein
MAIVFFAGRCPNMLDQGMTHEMSLKRFRRILSEQRFVIAGEMA